MQIRLLDPQNDPPAVVSLLNAYETEPITVDDFLGGLRREQPGRDIRRTVAIVDGAVAGYAYANHETWEPSGQYEVWTVIAPARRGQGLGKALCVDTIRYARARGACNLKSEVRENDPAALRFAQRLGFRIDRHIFESVLDLERFDAAPFREIEERVTAAGIQIHSLAELGFTRENLRKLHAVNYATALDIPGAEPSWMPFDEFAKMVMDDRAAWFRPAGQFGALDGEEWVGLGAVRLDEETHSSYNLMTGVLPAYRGRSIALALKLTAIRYARAAGALAMRTHNDSLNAPMLAVNRKLGYVPRPGKYILRG